MSLQNLLKPNNYELYINSETINSNTINTDNLVSTNISVGEISSLTNPGVIQFNSGIQFDPVDNLAINHKMDQYEEYSANLNISGAFNGSAQFKAVIIGSFVCCRLTFIQGVTESPLPPGLSIQFTPLPSSRLFPLFVTQVYCPVFDGVSVSTGTIKISTNGIMEIWVQNHQQGSVGFTQNSQVGIDIPNNTSFSFSYLLI